MVHDLYYKGSKAHIKLCFKAVSDIFLVKVCLRIDSLDM